MRMALLTLAAVAALVAAIYFIEHKGRVEGQREAKLAVAQEQNVELRESKRALDAMHRSIEAKERADAARAAQIAADHLKEKSRVEAERDRALADVRAGRVRLRLAQEQADAAGRDVVCMPAVIPGPAGSEPATQEAGFSDPRDEAAVRLLAEADAVVVELNKCWRQVRADRGLQESQLGAGAGR